MGIVETAEWLHLYYGRPEKLCEKFTKYIPLPKKGCIAFNFKRDVSPDHARRKGN